MLRNPDVSRKSTRKTKEAAGLEPTPKQQEVAKLQNKLNQFIPTPSQKEFIHKIENNVVTFVDGVAGSGKTSATLYHFCKQYLVDHTLKIVITRTPAEVGKDRIGFLPLGESAKIEPHFASTRYILEEFLGKAKVEADMDKRIFFTIPNFLLGSTMDNTLWLIDEAQLLQPIIMKLLLERIGKNTTVVVSGSATQIYTGDKDRNGMCDAMDKLFDNFGAKYPDFDYHKFNVDDVMRSEVVKNILRAYNNI